MGFFNTKEYDALDQAGKAWADTVNGENYMQRATVCMENNDVLRLAWILKKRNFNADQLEKICQVGINNNSYAALRKTMDMLTTAMAGYVEGYMKNTRRKILPVVMAAFVKGKQSEHWTALYKEWSDYLETSDVTKEVFKAGWLEKACDLLIEQGNFDAKMYQRALENWPGNKGSFEELLKKSDQVPLAPRQEILDHILYKAVCDGNRDRAESVIAAGGDVDHIRDNKKCGCLWRAAFNEQPKMIDLLAAHGYHAREIIPDIIDELRLEKERSPIIGHLEKMIGREATVPEMDIVSVPEPEEKPPVVKKQETTDGYSLVDSETLMHRQALPGTDIVLTTTFNFRTCQQILVTEVKGQPSTEIKSFDEVLGSEALAATRDKLIELGGKPDALGSGKKVHRVNGPSINGLGGGQG
jgi:hypothetical protein